MTREEYLKQVSAEDFDTYSTVKFADHQAEVAGGDYEGLIRIARAIHALAPIRQRELAEAAIYISRGDFQAQLAELQAKLNAIDENDFYKREQVEYSIHRIKAVMEASNER